MEIGGIVFILIVGVIVLTLIWGSSEAKKLKRNGKIIEAEYVKTELMFISKANDGVIGSYRLECQYTDPQTMKHYIFRSDHFYGRSMYYNHHKIKVLAILQDDTSNYEVDLSYLSSTDKTGIFLLETSVDLSKVVFEKDGEMYWKRENKKLSPFNKKLVNFLEGILALKKYTPKEILKRYVQKNFNKNTKGSLKNDSKD